MDFAVSHSKPFAVVPCCVFPRQHGHRAYKTSDGQIQPVTLCQQLVMYLQQKGGPSATIQHLCFEGANKVVWGL